MRDLFPYPTKDFSPEDAIPEGVKNAFEVMALNYWNAAMRHAGVRILTVPLRSNIFRGLLNWSKLMGEAAFPAYLVAVEAKAFANEMREMREGLCQ